MHACCRLEKLGWSKASGKAKVLGTLMGIGGAMVLTFYKGPNINIWNTHVDLLKAHKNQDGHVAYTHHNMPLGALLALASCVCYALWLIIQVVPVPQILTSCTKCTYLYYLLQIKV